MDSRAILSESDVGILKKKITELQKENEQYAIKTGRVKNCLSFHHNLYDVIPNGLYRSTPAGKIIYANPYLVKMLGYQKKTDLLDTNTQDFYVNKEERASLLFNNSNKKIVTINEVLLKRNDGTTFWAKITAQRILDETGDVQFLDGCILDISAQKENEKKIEDADATYKLIVENSKDAVVLLDSGKILFHNKNFAKLLKRNKKTLIDSEFSDYIYTDGKRKYSRLRKAIRSKVSFDEQFEIEILQSGNSTPIDVNVKLSNIDYQGNNLKLLLIENISGKKQSHVIEKALYKISEAANKSINEQQLFKEIHSIISGIMPAENFYIAMYDRETDLLDFPYFRDKYDTLPAKAKAGKGLTAYVIKTKRAQLIDAEKDEELRRKGKVELIGKPQAIWLGVPLKLQDKIIGAMVLQDYENPSAYGQKDARLLTFVSEQIAAAIDRVQKDKALKDSEEDYRTIFENAHDAILVIEPENEIILDANNKACNMYEVSYDEFVGTSLRDFSKNIGYGRSKIEETVKTGTFHSFETVHVTKSGKDIELENNTTIVNYKGKKAILTIERDISARKEAEKKITEYIEELENTQKILEKNAGDLLLLNEKIRTSENNLKESNKQKDMLFSVIAHDLRSPFTSLLGFTQYLTQELNGLSSDEIREFVASIDKSARNIYNLLENLLQWSRLRTESYVYNPARVNLYEVVNDIVNLYMPNAFRKKIELTNNVNVDTIVHADHNLINIIIRNLLSNAIKFTAANGQIIITAKENSSKTMISVVDNGVGISDRNIKRLFNMDERLSTQGTERESGTGLGLLLCKEFIDVMGGEISVASELKKGTTFTISLTRKI